MKPVKKFAKSLKKDAKSRKGLANAVRFVCLFLACFLFFIYAAIPATAGLWAWLGEAHAQAAGGLLSSVFGLRSSVTGNVITLTVGGEDVDFQITQLCSGDVEIALLASLLLATFEVLLIWRVVGAFLGAGLLLLLNPLRIALTIWITENSGLETGDAYHSVIFRLFLFVILVLYYFVWYRVFKNRPNRLQERISKSLRI